MAPTKFGAIVGVAKAYTTRVGAGPYPTEIFGDLGEKVREIGREYGTTTGRPRRVGWLDMVALRFATRINGFTHLNLTKLDVLSTLPEIKARRAAPRTPPPAPAAPRRRRVQGRGRAVSVCALRARSRPNMLCHRPPSAAAHSPRPSLPPTIPLHTHTQQIGVAYRDKKTGKTLPSVPADLGAMEAAEVVYETLPGWQSDISGVREWKDLPAAARAYVERCEVLAGTRIEWIGVGPGRDAIVTKP